MVDNRPSLPQQVRSPMSQYTPIAARLEIELDHEYLRMWNEWFCRWHYLGEDRPLNVDDFNGRMITSHGIRYSGTIANVYWDTIQRYLRKKLGTLFDQLEEELKTYPLDVRIQALNEVEGLLISFANKIRRGAAEKDRILRGDGFTFPVAVDQGNWVGAQPDDIKSRADALRHIYGQPRINIGGNDMPFSDMMNDLVTLVKKSGEVHRENIKALVSDNSVHIMDGKLPIEKDDHLLRPLPNGLVEDYIVVSPGFQRGMGGIPDFFKAKVRAADEPVASQQTIIAHLSGSNARMYVNSTDNSVSVMSSVTGNQLTALLAQIAPNLSALPIEARSGIQNSLAILEVEAVNPNPSQPKIRAALQSIKTVCEGTVGNLIATGIAGLIAPLL